MEEKDFIKAIALPIGKEHWSNHTGLKKVPNGLVLMFYDPIRDCISSSCFIPKKD